MERKLETSEQRIARVRKLIDDNQPIRVLPHRLTDHMLKRWYSEPETSKSRVPGRWFDRTVVAFTLFFAVADLLARQ